MRALFGSLAAACVLLLVSISSAAGGERLSATLGESLTELPASAIPSGILIDRALVMSPLLQLSSGARVAPIDAAQFRQMLSELTLAARPAPTWPGIERVRQLARQARARNEIPIGLLDVGYERLRADALAQHVLRWQGGKLTLDPSAAPGDATTHEHVFAAAALVDETYRGAKVTLVFPRELMVAHGPAAIVGLALDAGDGRGFTSVAIGRALEVAYESTGSKTLRLRVTRTDGSQSTASFVLRVAALDVPQPTQTWPLTATIAYQGVLGTGQAYIDLAPGHASLMNPVVVVEGFDLDNSMGWPELYTLLNQENLLEDMLADGYDAVVLDFTDATDYIQRNAYVLVELLQEVAAVDGGHDVAVVGASMGGLVARYALARMESLGIPHHARLMLSFDSPQNGANIPLGLQYWLDFFQGNSPDAAYLLSRLDTPAARQMLLYHHTTPPGATGQSDPLRAAFTADLAAVGDWPTQPRKVAVANGSGTGADQGYAAGAQLIRYEYTSWLVDITGNVSAVPDQASWTIFLGIIDEIWPLPDTSETVTVASTAPWDNAPGGYRASMAQMDTTAVQYGDIVALHDNHCFIPTVSALAMPTTDPFFDIAGLADPAAVSPFDAVYFPTVNQPHVTVTPENRVWLLNEIERASTASPHAPTALAALPTLSAARPNPFNPVTSIAFTLPSSQRARLSIMDARGRLVCVLVDGSLGAGAHVVSWRGQDDRGQPVGSGCYRSVLETDTGSLARPLVLVR